MADLAKSEVQKLIPKLSELQLLEVCDGLGLKLTKAKDDRKKALRYLLERYLSSEEVEDSNDEGLAIYTKLATDLKDLIQADEEDDKGDPKKSLDPSLQAKLNTLKMTVAGLGGGSGSESSAFDITSIKTEDKMSDGDTEGLSGLTSKLKVFNKDFKIQGGTIGGENQLDYGNVCFQMRDGLTTGYSEKQVISGVVRATKPGSELRRYFHGEKGRNLSFEDFKIFLRTHYRVRESSKIMDEMVACVQGVQQPLHNYVMLMFAYRDEILDATKGEDEPLGDALVKRRCHDSLLSGLRKPAIRLEMQALLQRNLPDPQLLAEVNLVMSRDEDNERKLGKSIAKAEVKAMEAESAARRKADERQEAMERNIDKLTAHVLRLEGMLKGKPSFSEVKHKADTSSDETVAALIAQVQHLEAQLQGFESDIDKEVERRLTKKDGFDGILKRKFVRFNACVECDKARKRCTHCRDCGKPGHKAGDTACEKN